MKSSETTAKVRILVVEDEGIVAKDIQNTLKGLGYGVSARASSGEEAIDKAADTQPDLILMDIVLKGGMDGVEAAEQIRTRFDIPVVYLTAYSDEETLQRAKITEPYGYVLKPFSERELQSNIEMALHKHRMAVKLKESEQRFRILVEHAPEAILLFDADAGHYVDANENALRLFGYDRNTLLSLGAADLLAPIQLDGRSAAEVAEEKIQTALEGEIPVLEVISRNAAGEHFSSEVRLARLPAEGRKLIRSSVTDITERKRAEDKIKASLKEKEVLLKEISHRVKNNLQLISSLLRHQSATIEDEQVLQVFRESQDRVRSIALIHEKLYQSTDLARIDFADYIRSLTSSLFLSYGASSEAIQLKIQAEDVFLGVDSAIPCALIINELVSNSLQHAFPDGREGEFCIELRLEQDQTVLMVSDNGVGFPEDLDFRTTETLGLELVRTLVDQLEGSIELDRSGGTAFKITFAGSRGAT